MPIDWDKVNTDTPPPAGTGTTDGVIDWDKVNVAQTEEEYQRLQGQVENVPPQKQEYWKDTWDYFVNRNKGGDAGVVTGMKGFQMAMEEGLYEKEKDLVSDDRMAKLKKEGIDPLEATMHPADWRRFIGGAVEMAPYMTEVAKQSVVGAVGGAVAAEVVAAPVDFLGGAVVGAVAGNLIPGAAILPEEPITGMTGGVMAVQSQAPTNLLFGATWGGRAGAFKASGQIMSGQMYVDLRKSGIPHKTAKRAALASGAIMAAIETMQFGSLASVPKKAMVEQLKTTAGKELVKKAVREFLKESGEQITEEELQQLVEMQTKYLIGKGEGNKELEEKNAPLSQEWWKQLGDTFVQSMYGIVPMVLGGRASGSLLGKAAKSMKLDEKPSYSILNATEDFIAASDQAEEIVDDTNNSATSSLGTLPPFELSATVNEARTEVQTQKKALRELKEKRDDIDAKGEAVPPELIKDIIYAKDKLAVAQEQKKKLQLEEVKNLLANENKDANFAQELNTAIKEKGKEVKALEVQKSIIESMDGEAPPELIKEIKDAKEQNKYLTDAKKELETSGAKQDLELRAQVEVEEALRQVKADATKRQVDKRIAEINVDLGAMVEKGKEKLQTRQAEVEQEIHEAKLERNKRRVDEKPTAQAENTIDRLEKERTALKAVESAMNAGVEFTGLDRNAFGDKAKSLVSHLAKVEKLTNEKQNLEELSGLIKDGALSGKDIDSLKTKLQTRQADKVVKLAAKNIARVSREAAQEKQNTITQRQSLLTSLVRQSLPKDEHGAFITDINAAATAKDSAAFRMLSQRIEDRISEILNAQEHAEADARLQAVVKSVKPWERGKRSESKFADADTQQFMDDVSEFISDAYKPQDKQQNSALKALNEHAGSQMQNAVAEDNTVASNKSLLNFFTGKEAKTEAATSTSNDARILAAQLTYNLNSMTAEEKHTLADELDTVIRLKKSEKLDKMAARKAKLQAAAVTAHELIQGEKEVDPDAVQRNLWQRLKHVKRTFGDFISPWDQLMCILDQHNFGKQKLEDLLSVTKAIDIEEKNKTIQLNKMMDTIAGGKDGKRNKKLLDRIVSGDKDEVIGEYLSNQRGENGNRKVKKLVMTRMELIQLWNQMRDPDLREGLRDPVTGNGFTFRTDVEGGMSTEDLVMYAMKPEDHQIADNILKFYDEYHGRVNDLNVEIFGLPLDKIPNYSGRAVRKGTSYQDGSNAAFMQEQFERRSLIPGFTISRTKNANALEKRNAVSLAMEHVVQTEHWGAWKDTEPLLRTVFSDRNVQETIKAKYGQTMWRHVEAAYMRMAGTRRQQHTAVVKLVDTMRRNAGPALTGGKLWQIPKQMTGYLAYLRYINPMELSGGIGHYLAFTKEANEILDTSGITMNRRQNLNLELQEMLTNEKIRSYDKDFTTKFKDAMTSPTGWGDIFTFRPGTWALYKAFQNRGTMTDEEALMKAIEISNQTQSSATADQMTPLEQTSLGRAFALFNKPSMQMATKELNDIRRFMSKPNFNTGAALMRTALAFHGSQFAFSLVASMDPFANAMHGGEDEDKYAKLIRAALLGPFQGFPLLGDCLNYMMTDATNWFFNAKEKKFEPKFMPVDSAKSALDMYERLTNAGKTHKQTGEKLESYDPAKPKYWFKIWHDFNRSAGLVVPAPLGGGIPWEPVAKGLEWFFTGSDSKSTETSSTSPYSEVELSSSDVNMGGEE